MQYTLEISITDLIKLIGWFVGVICILVAWAWNRMERSIKGVEEALEEHIKEYDNECDNLHKLNRDLQHEVDTLRGEHNAYHRPHFGDTLRNKNDP